MRNVMRLTSFTGWARSIAELLNRSYMRSYDLKVESLGALITEEIRSFHRRDFGCSFLVMVDKRTDRRAIHAVRSRAPGLSTVCDCQERGV